MGFVPDDVEADPKKLLIEILHAATLAAEGLPPVPLDAGFEYRPQYAMIIGLPFFPDRGEGKLSLLDWLVEGINMTREHLGVELDIFILLFSEAWPCEWSSALKFWDSQVMGHDALQP